MSIASTLSALRALSPSDERSHATRDGPVADVKLNGDRAGRDADRRLELGIRLPETDDRDPFAVTAPDRQARPTIDVAPGQASAQRRAHPITEIQWPRLLLVLANLAQPAIPWTLPAKPPFLFHRSQRVPVHWAGRHRPAQHRAYMRLRRSHEPHPRPSRVVPQREPVTPVLTGLDQHVLSIPLIRTAADEHS